MSVNRKYLERLNDHDSTKSLTYMVKKLFSGRKKNEEAEVIQIGVGGYISSGKTMLIDAMFSLFGNVNRPGFMPGEVQGNVLGHAKELLKHYKSQRDLRTFIAVNIGNDKKTLDTGKWEENTYCAKLTFCGKEKILLVRNLPGEIFEMFYTQSFDGHSIQGLYEKFLSRHAEYENIQKDLFKTPLPEKLQEIRQAFIYGFLDKELGRTIDEVTKNNLANNFYGLLFYLSSDYNIYCIKSTISAGREADAHLSNIYYFGGNDPEKFFICYTQVDTIMKPKQAGEPVRLPSFDDLTDDEVLEMAERKVTAKNLAKKALGWWKNVDANKRIKSDTPIMKYWQAMELLYEDFQQEEASPDYRYFDAKKMQALRGILFNYQYTAFLTSVAYHYHSDTFREFSQTSSPSVSGGAHGLPAALQLTASGDNDKEWTTTNLSMRTPIGVLEMMLNILSQNGLDLDKSNLEISKIKEYGFKRIITKIEAK